MIVVSNRIQVTKGQEGAFEQRFEGRARLVEHMPGFVRLEILRPMKSDYYVVLTYWASTKDFDAWTESPEFREAHAQRPPKEMFSGPNVFEMHEIVQHVERKA
ncbi:MAG TPA: antibiotic biosynthesis monooxygenase [Candidatus Methylomirabilis sp.]|jgi:heme-degrading monooxygenase HmoA|nr:antibiotic biosynthesis monooxygenase [Candidatus Methylomirabilis sp.]